MFIGEYEHTIDAKNRLAMPSRFRRALGATVVVTRGLDNCLFVYPMKEWRTLAEKLGSLSIGDAATRSFVRLMLSGASDSTPDKQGRIVIPAYLREYATLDKQVTIAGLYNRLEIWDTAAWRRYKENAERHTDTVAQRLGDMGVY